VPDNPDVAPDAFLSYTRLDDQFFGGAITSFRKLLELGVKVVTGRRDFDIFQDVDGIEFGQQWQKILDQMITSARVLLPIVTPLFFSSPGGRDELQKFLAHEKTLGRDDLILPIYYVTAPVLEKPDMLAKDPLAGAIAARQRYDWRLQANLAVDDPKARPAVMQLADKLAEALARTEGASAQPSVANNASEAISAPRNSQLTANDQEPAFRSASLAIQSQQREKQTQDSNRLILWVDDHPDNNRFEREAMEAYDISFELARSTGEALAKLQNTKFDAIISDMDRAGDGHAGYTLLAAVRGSGLRTPYFIYSSSNSPAHRQEALRREAQYATNRSDELIAEVLAYLNKPAVT
jgi:CheY-like chemotaxis protein